MFANCEDVQPRNVNTTCIIKTKGNAGQTWDQSLSLGFVSLRSQTPKLKEIYMITKKELKPSKKTEEERKQS